MTTTIPGYHRPLDESEIGALDLLRAAVEHVNVVIGECALHVSPTGYITIYIDGGPSTAPPPPYVSDTGVWAELDRAMTPPSVTVSVHYRAAVAS